MLKLLTSKFMKYRFFGKIIIKARNLLGAQYISFSQNLEDVIVDKLLEKKDGFYVDIGAHDPIRYSNTYSLYLNGWTGINIDPLPEFLVSFNKFRPKDVNLNIGISCSKNELLYYSFEEPAYNTTNKERADYCISSKKSSLKNVLHIKVNTLSEVFDEFLLDHHIDFMNIDVETTELDVLMSNDWNKYRPTIIAMESIVSSKNSIFDIKKDKAVNFLLDNDYIVIAKVTNAVFLSDNRNRLYK